MLSQTTKEGFLCPTNYFNTFIEVADDCPVPFATIPPENPTKKSGARLDYELMIVQPYAYTSDDILFMLYAQKQAAVEADHPALRMAFFSKGQACTRASDLTKKYGWGIHFNDQTQMALVPRGSVEYEAILNDMGLTHKKSHALILGLHGFRIRYCVQFK